MNWVEKRLIITSLLFLMSSITGCASQTVNAWRPRTGYESFEVTPVSNETGKSFDFDVTGTMRNLIVSKLEEEGFNLTSAAGRTLVIMSRLTLYDTRVAGGADCTVTITLIDKDTGKLMGEIVVARSVYAGGLPNLGFKPERAVLEMVADEIVVQIEKKIRVK